MKVFVAQFAGDGPENAGASGVAVYVDNDGGVVVKTNAHAAVAALAFAGSDNDGPDDIGFFDGHIGDGVFDDGNDHIADSAVAAVAASQYADAH